MNLHTVLMLPLYTVITTACDARCYGNYTNNAHTVYLSAAANERHHQDDEVDSTEEDDSVVDSTWLPPSDLEADSSSSDIQAENGM